MIINEITDQYEFPQEIKAVALNVVLDVNGTDGFVNIKASFGKKVEDKFIPFTLANGSSIFDVFSGLYSELIGKCIESKQLTNEEINNLITEVTQLREKIEVVSDLSLNMGYKAGILQIPTIPTNKK